MVSQLELLKAWIESHSMSDVRIIGDRIRIACPAVTRENWQFDEIHYVRTTREARDYLGY